MAASTVESEPKFGHIALCVAACMAKDATRSQIRMVITWHVILLRIVQCDRGSRNRKLLHLYTFGIIILDSH